MNSSLLVRNHTTHNPHLTRVRNLKTRIIKIQLSEDSVFPHHQSISNDSNIIHVRPLSKCLDIFRKSIDLDKLDTQCTLDWLCTSYKVLVEVDLYRNKINFSILQYECVSVCVKEKIRSPCCWSFQYKKATGPVCVWLYFDYEVCLFRRLYVMVSNSERKSEKLVC